MSKLACLPDIRNLTYFGTQKLERSFLNIKGFSQHTFDKKTFIFLEQLGTWDNGFQQFASFDNMEAHQKIELHVIDTCHVSRNKLLEIVIFILV